MPQDRDLDAFRRFYADGGYVDRPKKRDRLADLELAYNSQYYAGGGQVPGFGDGGLFKGLREYIRGYSKPIKAWHGSPHDFDKFDASKIGTGEGAQIYGHGLYFAENPSVAKFYRDTLAPKNRDLIRPDQAAQDAIKEDWEDLVSKKNALAPNGYTGNLSPEHKIDYSLLEQRLNNLHNWAVDDTIKRNPHLTQGRLYGVDIHENPENFLSLDKPFAAQDEVGKRSFDALSQIDSSLRRNPDRYFYGNPTDVPSLDDPRFSTQALWNDVLGTRYLDAMSRRKGMGTSNYVVFPGAEDIVDITGKYAEGGKVDDEQKRRWLLYAGFLNDGT